MSAKAAQWRAAAASLCSVHLTAHCFWLHTAHRRLLPGSALYSSAVFLSATHRVSLLTAESGPQPGTGCLQEKFELVRGLREQQRLTGVLADENQAMTDEFNRQVCHHQAPGSAASSCLPAARKTACCTPPLPSCRRPRYSRAAPKSDAARSRLLPSTWLCRGWLPNGMPAATAPRRRLSRSR